MTTRFVTVCNNCAKEERGNMVHSAPVGWMYIQRLEVIDRRGVVQVQECHFCQACWASAGALALTVEDALHEMVEGGKK